MVPRSKIQHSATFFRLMLLARGERTSLLFGTIFLLITIAMNFALPQGVRIVVDGVYSPQAAQRLPASAALAEYSSHIAERDRVAGSKAKVDRGAIAMVAILAVFGLSIWSRYLVLARAGERAEARLRERLLASLMSQEMGFHDSQRVGELMSRLSADTNFLQNLITGSISAAIAHGVALAVGLVLLLSISPKLTNRRLRGIRRGELSGCGDRRANVELNEAAARPLLLGTKQPARGAQEGRPLVVS